MRIVFGLRVEALCNFLIRTSLFDQKKYVNEAGAQVKAVFQFSVGRLNLVKQENLLVAIFTVTDRDDQRGLRFF